MARRGVSQGDLVAKTRELASLQEAWARFNKPTVNRELRNSLYTKIAELKAEIEDMKIALKRSTKHSRRQAVVAA